MEERSTCLSAACGITVEGNLTKCPECGWAMRGPRNIRMRGWVLVAIGLFLVLFMGAIAWSLLPSMLQPGKEMADGSMWTGTEAQTEMALSVFALVILFGLLSLINGVWMIATGRTNRALTVGGLVIAAILVAIAWAVKRKLI